MKIGENQEEAAEKGKSVFMDVFVENVIDRRIFEAYHR